MNAPTTTLNTPSGSRHQVPLRDYLNTRVAPFLKKALTESLDKEAEYPLQYLGECLINYSILYEGNTEAEKLKERFKYDFSKPAQTQQPQPPQQTSDPVNGAADGSMSEAVNGTDSVAEEQGVTEQAGEAQGQSTGDTEMGGTT